MQTPIWVKKTLLGSLIAVIFVVLAASGWSAWLKWVKYQEVEARIEAVKGAKGDVDWQAAWVLRKTGGEAYWQLVGALRDHDSRVRQGAAIALAELGPELEPALPMLIEALDDRNAEVRQSVAYAIGRIGPSGEEAVASLRALLDDSSSAVRLAVAEALWEIQHEPNAVSAVLVQIVSDGGKSHFGERERLHAIYLLSEMAPAASEAVPSLIEALTEGDSLIATAASQALARWRGLGVPELVDALAIDEPAVRAHAAYALGEIGPAARAALPVLAAAEQSVTEEKNVRFQARQAIRKIDLPESDPPLATESNPVCPQFHNVPGTAALFVRESPTRQLGRSSRKQSKR